MTDLVGGKMANLGDVKNRLHMNVPEGFVITAAAHDMFMQADGLQREIDRLFQVAGSDEDRNLDLVSSQIRQLIMSAEVPEPIYLAVVEAYTRMKEANNGQEIRMAVRSSAYGEDAENSSFAGQYRSELNVGFSQFFYYYKQVMATKYSVQAIAYKINRGFRDEDIAMCVGCLAMVDAIAGGVIYTRNPLDTKDDAIYINSTWGLPKAVVDGNDLCDLFVVSRDDALTILRREVREKGYQVRLFRRARAVSAPKPHAGQASMPSLTDEQVQELADHAIRIEQYYETAPGYRMGHRRRREDLYSPIPAPAADGIGPARSGTGSQAIRAVPAGRGRHQRQPRGRLRQSLQGAKKVDILQFPEGAILVVEQALPTWAPLVARAAAVISEQGGFAGHLANVAREFGIPALFGVSGAMDRCKTAMRSRWLPTSGGSTWAALRPLLEWTRPEPKLMLGQPGVRIAQGSQPAYHSPASP